MNPGKMVESRAAEYVEANDSDGDGYLSASELSSLSEETFSAADVDGDGLLSQDELVSTIKEHMEQVRMILERGSAEESSESVQSLLDSAQGELFRAIMPPPPDGEGPGQVAASTFQDNTDLASSWCRSLLNLSE